MQEQAPQKPTKKGGISTAGAMVGTAAVVGGTMLAVDNPDAVMDGVGSIGDALGDGEFHHLNITGIMIYLQGRALACKNKLRMEPDFARLLAYIFSRLLAFHFCRTRWCWRSHWQHDWQPFLS